MCAVDVLPDLSHPGVQCNNHDATEMTQTTEADMF